MKKTIQVFIVFINKQHHVETQGNWYSLRTEWHQGKLDQSDIQHISYVFSPFLFLIWVMHKLRSSTQIEHLLYGRNLLGFKDAQIPICAFWLWGAHNLVGFLNVYWKLTLSPALLGSRSLSVEPGRECASRHKRKIFNFNKVPSVFRSIVDG